MLGTPPQADVSCFFYAQVGGRQRLREVTAVEDEISGSFVLGVPTRPMTRAPRRSPSSARNDPRSPRTSLVQVLIDQGVEVNAEPEETASLWQQVLLGFGRCSPFIGLLICGSCGAVPRACRAVVSATSAGPGRSSSPGQRPRTTFADVAGIDEVKAEGMEVVDFLKNPQRHRSLARPFPAACCSPVRPAIGKTPSREPSRVRRTCPSSTCPPRSSSR